MYNYNADTGVIVPDTADVLSVVQDEYKAAFGSDLNVAASTPQGALITAQTAARTTFLQNNAALANQINPNLAGGIFLDAILALTGVERDAAQASYAVISCAGVAGTVIPAGSIVEDASENQFASAGIITLDSGGNGSGTFYCTVKGPIAAPADTLNVIVDGVIGWETATNSADAVLGQSVQSDDSARTERQFTLAAQGTSLSEAIIAAVTLVPDVLGAPSYRDNPANTTQNINGITMVPHSIYVCASGGTDLAVATAIYSKKSGGCNYNNGASGNPVSQSVVDPYSGQTQTVLFDRPDMIQILVQVNILASTAVVDPTDTVTQAILDYVTGGVAGEPGWGVGKTVFYNELSGAINRAAPNLIISSLKVSLSSPVNYQPANIAIALWEQAFTNESSIVVNLV